MIVSLTRTFLACLRRCLLIGLFFAGVGSVHATDAVPVYKAGYAKVCEKRLADAQRIIRETESMTRLTFALGVHTSHGRISSARDISDYLQIAQRVALDGTAFFTWSPLVLYLDEVIQSGDLHRFKSAAAAGNRT